MTINIVLSNESTLKKVVKITIINQFDLRDAMLDAR